MFIIPFNSCEGQINSFYISPFAPVIVSQPCQYGSHILGFPTPPISLYSPFLHPARYIRASIAAWPFMPSQSAQQQVSTIALTARTRGF